MGEPAEKLSPSTIREPLLLSVALLLKKTKISFPARMSKYLVFFSEPFFLLPTHYIRRRIYVSRSVGAEPGHHLAAGVDQKWAHKKDRIEDFLDSYQISKPGQKHRKDGDSTR